MDEKVNMLMDRCRTGKAVVVGTNDAIPANCGMHVGDFEVDKFMVVESSDGERETVFDVKFGDVIIDDRIEEGDEIVLVSKWVRKKDLMKRPYCQRQEC